jgi:RimJ/RimL family protein N-acetyltransferase
MCQQGERQKDMTVTLKTERLTLRPPVLADFPDYRTFMMSPRSSKMGGPYDGAGAWFFFCHDVAQWQFFEHGGLMMIVTASGECVGQVGINHGPLFPEKELGWFVYEGQEGKGYATEAARALRDWAFATLGLASLVSYVDPGNPRSAAVAQRLGAVVDPQAKGKDPADIVYRHHNPARH